MDRHVAALFAMTGFCAFWGSKLKYFASYAVILAGWSAAVVATDAIHNPQAAIQIGGARISVFIIGILAVMFVFGIAHARKGFAAYLPPLKDMNDRIIQQIKQIILVPASYDHVDTMRHWAADIEAMSQGLDYAGAEDPEVALHARSIRCGLNDFFADAADLNIQLQQAGLALANTADAPLLQEIQQDFIAALDARLQETDAQAIQRNTVVRQKVLDYYAVNTSTSAAYRAMLLDVVTAAGELINTMNVVRRSRETLNQDDVRPLNRPTTTGYALYTAAAVTLTMLIAWGVVIVNEWQPYGAKFIVLLTILLLVISITEDPVGRMKKMLPGCLGGMFAGLICNQVLLPLSSGFPWLVLCFAVTIIIPGCLLRVFPRTAETGNMVITFGIILSMPDNQMVYDLQSFLNDCLAAFAAIGLALGSALIFFPGRAAEKYRLLSRHAIQDLLRLPDRLRSDSFAKWEDWQQGRVMIINGFADLNETVFAQKTIRNLLIMMQISRCFYRQHTELNALALSSASGRLLEQATWFWDKQFASPIRFQVVAEKLIDSLEADAKNTPAKAIPLLGAANEWRVILQNNAVLAAPLC